MSHTGFIKISHVISGLVAVLVGYTGSVAIIFQAAEVVGATQAQANSWMLVLGLGMGISGILLSLWYKMPILTAWSTPGAALLVVSLDGVSIEQATGAFLFCAALLTLSGLTGWFAKISHLIPDALASAMLAGILFRFGQSIFPALQENTVLVAGMCLTYLFGRQFLPRYTIPVVLLVGIALCWLLGLFPETAALSLTLAKPVFVAPVFTVSVLLGTGLPLFIVTMTGQNMPGVVALKAAGYTPPVSASLTITGLTSLLLAPFGGFAFNLAAITAAICAGPEADENPETRYKAALMAGLFYCLVGLFGATVISLFLLAPKALVVTIAGLALLSTIANSLSHALASPQRDAALVTFMTTVSGISFFGIGAPLWGLLFGVLASIALRQRHG